jgi:hypothetical protein
MEIAGPLTPPNNYQNLPPRKKGKSPTVNYFQLMTNSLEVVADSRWFFVFEAVISDVFVRCFVDGGAECSLVLAATRERLGLKTSPCDVVIRGVGGAVTKITKLCEVLIQIKGEPRVIQALVC